MIATLCFVSKYLEKKEEKRKKNTLFNIFIGGWVGQA
jgi:hypothetical protein